jgi:molecular chaperone GrpE
MSPYEDNGITGPALEGAQGVGPGLESQGSPEALPSAEGPGGGTGLEAPAEPEAPTDWEDEANRLRDLYMRAAADLENTKRRFQKDKEENARYASESVIREIIPFLDNLYLALSYAPVNEPVVKNLADGVSMTLKGCLDRLGDWGLKEVKAERGQSFDPNLHEAISQEPDPDLTDMTIKQPVGRGYTLHQRLLRPAQVIVVKNNAAAGQETVQ